MTCFSLSLEAREYGWNEANVITSHMLNVENTLYVFIFPERASVSLGLATCQEISRCWGYKEGPHACKPCPWGALSGACSCPAQESSMAKSRYQSNLGLQSILEGIPSNFCSREVISVQYLSPIDEAGDPSSTGDSNSIRLWEPGALKPCFEIQM